MHAISATHDVTHLLAQWANRDERALEDLTPLVYKELRRLAASHLRKERKSHTLQPTALVHEAYLRLVGQNNPRWEGRAHFYGVAARLSGKFWLNTHGGSRHLSARRAQCRWNTR